MRSRQAREAGRRLRRRSRGLALLLATLSACQAAASGSRPVAVGVALEQTAADVTQLRVRMPASAEPDMAWSGHASGRPYRIALVWHDMDLQPQGELPAAAGPVRTVALRSVQGASRLEMQLDEPVVPSLRRRGDAWVLSLAREVAPVREAVAPVREAVARAREAAPPPPATRKDTPPPAAQGPQMLLVDLTVNGQKLPDVVQVEEWPNGRLLLAANAWTQARLAADAQPSALSDGTPAYALEQVAGLTYRLDPASLRMEINAPASAFAASRLGPQGPLAVQARPPDAGVVVNYDVSASAASRSGGSTAGAMVEAVAFGSMGHFVASGLVMSDGERRTATRLDTYWQMPMPQRMETLTVGDTIGVGGGWSRPAHFAGVKWGTDFGLRPGFVTMPQVSLAGEAALPSTVDVLVDNARRMSLNVAPGPFDLVNVPIHSGAGQVSLVVRDLLGRETLVNQSYYASPRLLAPGLMDFSAEAGWLRTGYGKDSEYGDPFAALTLRRGLTQQLTGEARIEVERDRQAAGVEIAGLLGDFGVARAAFAVSREDAALTPGEGHLLQLGVERMTNSGGASLQYEHASRGFAPFGESTDPAASAQRSRDRWLASVGGRLWPGASGAATLVRQTRWDGDRVTSLGLTLGLTVFQRGSLSLSVNKRLDGDRAWSAGVNFIMPLDDDAYAGGRIERANDGRTAATAVAARNAPVGPGLGWRVEASTEPGQRARGAVQWNTEHAEVAVDGVAQAGGRVAVRAGARGSIGMMGGVPFAARPVGQGSFALVETEGLANVPVRRANQVVATTDENGRAFVAGLLPWQRNEIQLDPQDLPMDVEVDNLVQQLTPHARAGNIVRFGLRRTRQALLVLHQEGGEPVPVGADVTLVDEALSFEAGRRGEVWVTGFERERQKLQVRWQGGACRLEVSIPAAEDGIPPTVGPLACTKVAP